MIEQRDFDITPGTDVPPLIFRIAMNGSGSSWEFFFKTYDQSLVYPSLTAQNVVVGGVVQTEVSVKISVEQSRLILNYPRSFYRLTQIEPSGGRRAWIEGTIGGACG